MKKKIPDMIKEYDIYMREKLNLKGIMFLGSSHSVLQNSPLQYQKQIDELEKELLNDKINLVKH